MRYWDPSTYRSPELTITATRGGYEITVGHRSGKHWYPCARKRTTTRWGTKRAGRKLIRWYNRHVQRQLTAGQLENDLWKTWP